MASALTTSPIPAGSHKVPLLANGDHLTRDEFERRYAAMPEGIKAELIEGVVYMAPPVRYDPHGKAQSILSALLNYYAAKTPGIPIPADNTTVRLDNDNEPQPDLFLMLPPHTGGHAIVGADGYVVGPPALACEIAASSVNIDLHRKKAVYRRNGVQEYLVWRTEDAAIDWFSLEAGDYVPIPSQADGTLCSKIFPGLCVHPTALLNADLPALFALLDSTTATPEHESFVLRLRTS
ncbi:MAG TPA: Uma2 family endonuclease [Tepidisphaeraceae bacterium]|jgi:Uma2 family endonuclease|nr:Uma2 family endonuclease [Tepidisphaeraceae bacterium]